MSDEPEYFQEIKRLDCPDFIAQCEYKGINFWPLVRLHLLLNFKNQKNERPKRTLRKRDKLSLKDFLLTRFKSGSVRRKIPQADFLLISDKAYYTDNFDRGAYNRYIDPFVEKIEEAGRSYLCFYSKDSAKNDLQNTYNRVHFFDERWTRMLERNQRNDKLSEKISIRFQNLFLEYDLDISAEAFTNHVNRIIYDYKLYKGILKQVDCKKILLVCWYDVSKMGLILAARDLNIPTYDIQHGKQGKYHHTYYHWKTYIKDYKWPIPNYFLMWSEEFSNNIQEINNFQPDYFNTLVTGNLWMNKWLEFNHNLFLSDEQGVLLSKIKEQGKKIILFASQPIEFNFHLEFLQKLSELNPDSLILIRCHPTYREFNESLITELKKLNLSNVDCVSANKLPLYTLLKIADYTLTLWSTVCLEAVFFGSTSVIIHKNGLKIFKKEIEMGVLDYWEKPREVSLQRKNEKEMNDYFSRIEKMPFLDD